MPIIVTVKASSTKPASDVMQGGPDSFGSGGKFLKPQKGIDTLFDVKGAGRMTASKMSACPKDIGLKKDAAPCDASCEGGGVSEGPRFEIDAPCEGGRRPRCWSPK